MASVPNQQTTELPGARRGLSPTQLVPLGLLAVILAAAIFGPGTLGL